MIIIKVNLNRHQLLWCHYDNIINQQKRHKSLYFSETVVTVITAKAYLEPSRISTMDLFYKNSSRLLDVKYFRKKTTPQMLDWVLNIPLKLIVLHQVLTKTDSPISTFMFCKSLFFYFLFDYQLNSFTGVFLEILGKSC